jgi:hypothetical protein
MKFNIINTIKKEKNSKFVDTGINGRPPDD